jgi:hypothetical protein
MIRTRLAIAVGVAAAAMVFGSAQLAWSHPLHTTLADISIDASGTMQLTIRAFADDFGTAVARHAGRPRPADYQMPDGTIAAYVSSAVHVEDAAGRAAPLIWAGQRRAGDVIWVTMRVPSVRDLRGVKVASALLGELFEDQVNIVQTQFGGRRHSVLFTAGEGHKARSIL